MFPNVKGRGKGGKGNQSTATDYIGLLLKRSPELEKERARNTPVWCIISAMLCGTHVVCIADIFFTFISWCTRSKTPPDFDWGEPEPEFPSILVKLLSKDSNIALNTLKRMFDNAKTGWDYINNSFDAIGTSPAGALLMNTHSDIQLIETLLKHLVKENLKTYLSDVAAHFMTSAWSKLLNVELPTNLKWIYMLKKGTDTQGVIIPCPLPTNFKVVQLHRNLFTRHIATPVVLIEDIAAEIDNKESESSISEQECIVHCKREQGVSRPITAVLPDARVCMEHICEIIEKEHADIIASTHARGRNALNEELAKLARMQQLLGELYEAGDKAMIAAKALQNACMQKMKDTLSEISTLDIRMHVSTSAAGIASGSAQSLKRV